MKLFLATLLLGVVALNVFQKSVIEKRNEIAEAEKHMVDFSEDLRILMEISKVDLQTLMHHWDVGEYTVATRLFCMTDGWRNLLYAYPREHNEPGWVNKEFNNDPSKFFYKPKGTATLFYPLLETSIEILAAVEKMK